ncbi:MAG: enoyl-CoA hydratase-related protein [Acidimicrobiia bacterium]|nr:enoyl-CoA hydratase-related protein [Acidimicrobiia bacterium]
MAYVDVDRSDPTVPVVTLDRPERLNALGTQLVSDLKAAIASLTRDRAARCIVIAGAGRSFCAGADLQGGGQLAPDAEGRGPVGSIYRAQEHIAEAMLAIHECEKPVIAAVHGAAVGGGLAIALAADLRVADETAVFGSVFIKVGLSSCDMGTSYFLPRIVGATRAAELMLTGRHFDANEADRYGMLNRLVPEGAHLDAARELAALVAANNEYGVWMTKKGLWENIDSPSFRHALEVENRTQVLGTFTGNMQEATRAFRDKRDPEWEPM